MRKFKLATSIIGLLLFASACSNVDNANYKQKALFYTEDSLGDDSGPGAYTYPTDKIYLEGAFDIREFAIYEGEDYYEFFIRINRDFKNDKDYFGGWDVQMFDVYLQFDQGKHTMAVNGRNVKFSDKWNKAVVIAPERKTRVQREIYKKNTEVSDYVSDYEDIASDVIVPDTYIVDFDTLSARISKEKLEGLEDLRGVQVFSLGFDLNADEDNTYNMTVEKFTGQFNFGGGSNYNGNPNVIDILGSNKILEDYLSEEGYEIYPTVDFIEIKK